MCQAKRKIKEEFSCFKINDFLLMPKRGRSSVGRAPPCQGGCRVRILRRSIKGTTS